MNILNETPPNLAKSDLDVIKALSFSIYFTKLVGLFRIFDRMHVKLIALMFTIFEAICDHSSRAEQKLRAQKPPKKSNCVTVIKTS